MSGLCEIYVFQSRHNSCTNPPLPQLNSAAWHLSKDAPSTKKEFSHFGLKFWFWHDLVTSPTQNLKETPKLQWLIHIQFPTIPNGEMMTSLKPRPPRTGSVMFYSEWPLSDPFDLMNMKMCPVTEDMLTWRGFQLTRFGGGCGRGGVEKSQRIPLPYVWL